MAEKESFDQESLIEAGWTRNVLVHVFPFAVLEILSTVVCIANEHTQYQNRATEQQ